MFADALNLIIAKKKYERKLEDKRKDYILKKDYCKLQIIENEGEITEIKKSPKWERSTKVIYEKIVWFYPLDS